MATTFRLRTHYLPQFVGEHELAGGTVVVIDLLRASTTICHALAAGAVEVVPFVEVDALLAALPSYSRAEVILGGERRGLPLEGFDLGNSPVDYTPAEVVGKRVLFTTTNGTRALEHARLARRVLIGAVVNAAAVAESIVEGLQPEEEVHLLCAGTDGHVSREDILAAGAITEALLSAGAGEWQLDLHTEQAHAEWRELVTIARASSRTLPEQLAEELRSTLGGKNLIALGLDDDLVTAARLNAVPVVPEWEGGALGISDF